MRIGVLHPGEMGISVAQALVASGHHVGWAAAGRGAETAARAQALHAYDDLPALLGAVDAVISVCPPHAALEQAQAVVAAGFQGVYVDANAVAPTTAEQMRREVGENYVDGGIIGPPAVEAGTTRLYLSGDRAVQVSGWFTGGALQAVPVEGAPTAASSLKMAYAAYTKGSSALLLAVNALAEAAGVRAALEAEWALSQPGLPKRSETSARGTSRKAWRFVGEMQEIARTFREFDLPDDFHQGATEIYRRMAALKDHPASELAAVLAQILDGEQDRG